MQAKRRPHIARALALAPLAGLRAQCPARRRRSPRVRGPPARPISTRSMSGASSASFCPLERCQGQSRRSRIAADHDLRRDCGCGRRRPRSRPPAHSRSPPWSRRVLGEIEGAPESSRAAPRGRRCRPGRLDVDRVPFGIQLARQARRCAHHPLRAGVGTHAGQERGGRSSTPTRSTCRPDTPVRRLRPDPPCGAARVRAAPSDCPCGRSCCAACSACCGQVDFVRP